MSENWVTDQTYRMRTMSGSELVTPASKPFLLYFTMCQIAVTVYTYSAEEINYTCNKQHSVVLLTLTWRESLNPLTL